MRMYTLRIDMVVNDDGLTRIEDVIAEMPEEEYIFCEINKKIVIKIKK